jgi:putative phosphoribosyl transferase
MLRQHTRTFRDRRSAGRELGERLSARADEDPVVIGLARGGVPVAHEVAVALGAPLDVLVVRKIGAPANPEYGIGAVAEGGVRVLNEDAIRLLMMSPEELEASVARAQEEVDERVRRYRDGRLRLALKGRTVILVDDGLATGGTARAALRALRTRDPRRLVLAVPVGAPETVAALSEEADEVVCLRQPTHLRAVGAWYEHFEPTPDSEVVEALAGATVDPPAPRQGTREIRVAMDAHPTLVGDLALPHAARGVVVFAHGSGSSRHSPRNRHVAATLNEHGLATLLLDLLTPGEERDRAKVFDVELLACRLVAATRFMRGDAELATLKTGYFGASTGAAAALWAAAELGDEIAAVVSRGGRPDLAASRLVDVRAPVLLIVGGRDEIVLELNRQAQSRLSGPSKLSIVPGATHLFEEPGALDEVARQAAAWFERQLAQGDAS